MTARFSLTLTAESQPIISDDRIIVTSSCMVMFMKNDSRSEILLSFTSSIATAVPLLIAGEPGAAMAALSAAAPSLISGTAQIFKKKNENIHELAWQILSKSYALGLARFLSTVPLERRPKDKELEALITRLVTRAQLIAEQNSLEITPDMLFAPLKIPFLRDAAKIIPGELQYFSPDGSIIECRRLFEESIFKSISYVRREDPISFGKFESTLAGPFKDSAEKRKALALHHEGIIRAFTQRPIFGQEETGITLAELYVRQRCIWNTKIVASKKDTPEEADHDAGGRGFFDDDRQQEKWSFPLHVDDLHSTTWKWLDSKDCTDAIRVVAGGPGSGKSTFARALAVEAIDKGTYDVLFVPLQEIEATGLFQQRIEHLFRDRTDLGLDRVPNPLLWLGQRDSDNNPPERPLLLICDGLDEIAPPESAEAATVTADFIQALKSWMDSRNSGGLFTRAIVLGRTISAQEAFRKAAIDPTALLRVGGLLPITITEEWRSAERSNITADENGLAEIDQRTIFWKNWCVATSAETDDLPAALQGDTHAADALRDLTTEPLLLYLLIWTGYLGERWEIAAENRNNVYEEIFRQIYVRRWGIGSANARTSNRQRGGHSLTQSLEQEDFFLLQEALGLAAWSNGGRTVSSESYQALLPIYLGVDKYEDLSGDLSGTLKSVALQSYTRSVGTDNAGYEFVHKSLGEYLIARGLTTWVFKSIDPLAERQTDARCANAAQLLSKITWSGPLTAEIFRFFEDEIRLRLNSVGAARNIISKFLPLTNWIVSNGIPVHREVPGNYSLLRLEVAEKRALDVFWAAVQSVARQAYPLQQFGLSESLGGWNTGPLKINWQGPYGFLNFYGKLSSQLLIAETKRISRFDYLSLNNQSLSECSFGIILYAANKDGTVSPREWLPISLVGTDLSGVDVFGTSFWSADLRYADLSNAALTRVNLVSANLSFANLRRATLAYSRIHEADLSNVDFTGATLSGASFRNCTLRSAKLHGVNSGQRYDFRHADDTPLVFQSCDLTGLDISESVLSQSVFCECEMQHADISGSNLSEAFLVNTDISNCKIDSATKVPTKRRVISIPSLKKASSKSSRDLIQENWLTGFIIRSERDQVNVMSIVRY